MMKLKKIGAIVLAVMMTAICTVAWAADGLTDGKFGTFTAPDTPTSSTSKKVDIAKELFSDNADDADVKAPSISYTYAITAGSSGKTITDAEDAHDPDASVTVTTKQGVTTDLDYTTEISWSPADTLEEGSNIKNITIDFSNVVFSGYGVYRYVITEKPANKTAAADIAEAYADAGVTGTEGSHVRYLDVYVKPSASYSDGTKATDWDIYGYVCFTADNSINAEDDSGDEPDVSAAGKTNGFVEATVPDPDHPGETITVPADTYYSFNVTISKTVAGDQFVMSNHAEFPFTAAFTNETVTEDVLPIVSVSDDYATIVSAALTAGDINDITAHQTTIGHEGSVTYTGLPSGTEVTVKEKNNQTGTTYKVTTTGITTNLEEAVAAGSDSSDAVAVAQDALEANESVTIAFTNTLSLISPTGYVSRYAPYALILVGGVALLLVAKKHRKHEEEE